MTFEKIALQLKDNNGLGRYSLGDLRDALGMGKLGTRMIKDIEGRLANLRIRHLPRELPHDSQDRMAVLYLQDSEIGELIDAVRKNTPNSVDYKRLKKAADALADSHVLRQIERLLEDQ